jgi:CYTH domain-containing protein
VPAGRPGYLQGLITNIYLTEAEYDLLAALDGDVLTKVRVSVPPLSIDVFDPPLDGLVIAEIEFAADEPAESFPLPPTAVAEVTGDSRFTGGSLARACRRDVLSWLSEYGINLSQATDPRHG